jgi:hypothetical protein
MSDETNPSQTSEVLIQAYVSQLFAVQARRQAELGEADLSEIAQELGLSEADLAAAERAASDHHARGVGFVRHKNWTEAISELERACALRPAHVPSAAALASAYERRFKAEKREEDRAAAELYARRCLLRDPRHGPSFKLLSTLGSASDAKTDAEWTTLLWGLGLGGLLLAALVAYMSR